jgi:hypothetical protein
MRVWGLKNIKGATQNKVCCDRSVCGTHLGRRFGLWLPMVCDRCGARAPLFDLVYATRVRRCCDLLLIPLDCFLREIQ